MKKQCFKCKKEKSIEQFYAHKQMSDGHLGKCKKCTKADVQNRYQDPEAKKRIKEYERLRNLRPERRKKKLVYERNRRVIHPGKYRANKMLGNAIRDKRIIKLPCEVCGNIKSQGHHPDYRRPLYVKWLCFKHHREEHGQTVN